MSVAIVKYNAGNIRSVVNALHRLGVEAVLTDDASVLGNADKILFPGQGEASSAMAYLREHRLDEVIKGLTQPVLGICIGQQLLCRHSEEGDTGCLGIFDVDVYRFHPTRHEDKVPAMGWQEVRPTEASLALSNEDGASREDDLNRQACASGNKSLFRGNVLNAEGGCQADYFYFVHSYYVPLCKWTIAEADYILPYSAAPHKDNFWSTQFHPEKSGRAGEQLLKNFLAL